MRRINGDDEEGRAYATNMCTSLPLLPQPMRKCSVHETVELSFARTIEESAEFVGRIYENRAIRVLRVSYHDFAGR
jgi:hypothetical protein